MKIINKLVECKQWFIRIIISRYIINIAKKHNIKDIENVKVRWLGDVVLTEYAYENQYKEWKELDSF